MNRVEKLLWATCVFVISQHVESTTEQQEQGTGNEPKIHSITLSPPTAVEIGEQVFATTRFYSPGPVPVRYWEMVYMEGWEFDDIKEELWVLSENEYESKVSLGSIEGPGWVSLTVNNTYGTHKKTAQVGVVLPKLGARCNLASVCTPKYSECNKTRRYCYCREGYHVIWFSDDTDCKPNFFADCQTSEFCQEGTNNSECHPEKKKCFCDPGYGLDYDVVRYNEYYDPDCIKYPIRKVKIMLVDAEIQLRCKVDNSNLTDILWFDNDGEDLCKANSSRCSINQDTHARQLVMRVNRNDTFTCMAFTSDEGNVTVSETEIIVGEKPEIRKLTPLRPGRQPKGDEVVIVARIYSTTGKPTGEWWLKPKYKIEYKEDLKEESTVLPGNEYEIRASLGPIYEHTTVRLKVKNQFGEVQDTVEINVGLKYGQECSSGLRDCMDDDVVCNDPWSPYGRCECRKGYFWNESSICDKVEIPEIRELTLLHPGRQPKGDEVVVVARVYSTMGKPTGEWWLRPKYKNEYKQDLKEELLTVLPDNEYEIRASLGPIYEHTTVRLKVKNGYAEVQDRVEINVGLKYGQECSWELRDCMDDDVVCTDSWSGYGRCECRQGYFWNESSICDKKAELTQSCETSDQCQAVTGKSECEKLSKRCFCPKGYEIYYDYQSDTRYNCKTDPSRTEQNVIYTEKATLHCKVVISSLSEIVWYLNGNEVCTHGSTWCSQDESTKYDETSFEYSRSLELPKVIKNDVYTCQAFTSDRKNWTVSEIGITVGAKFKQPCGTSDQCQNRTRDSECDQQKKRCFCPAGYQYFSESYSSAYCKNYTSHEEQNVKFSEGATLRCEVVISNLSDIVWYRNDNEVCTHGSTWCSQEKSMIYEYERSFEYSRRLELPSVIQNDVYTCKAFTRDGKNWNVKEVAIKVEGSFEQVTTPSVYGSNVIIDCGLKRANAHEIHLFRDAMDLCKPEATWCSQFGTTRDFEVLNLRANHTFICDTHTPDKKRAIVKIHHILIDTKPQILEMTQSPPGAVLTGSELFVTARFYSLQKEASVRRWKIDGVEQPHQDELRVVSDYEFESKLRSYKVERSNDIIFEVSDIYGEDRKHVKVETAVTYGQKCSSTVVCMTNGTECDAKSGQCLCRKGYYWNSMICHKNGAVGVLAAQKEGIIILALTILFTLFRSTTSTAC